MSVQQKDRAADAFRRLRSRQHGYYTRLTPRFAWPLLFDGQLIRYPAPGRIALGRPAGSTGAITSSRRRWLGARSPARRLSGGRGFELRGRGVSKHRLTPVVRRMLDVAAAGAMFGLDKNGLP